MTRSTKRKIGSATETASSSLPIQPPQLSKNSKRNKSKDMADEILQNEEPQESTPKNSKHRKNVNINLFIIYLFNITIVGLISLPFLQ